MAGDRRSWRGVVLSLVPLAAVLVGCTSGASGSGVVAPTIRSFDFGDAAWYDAQTASVVGLRDGLAHADRDPSPELARTPTSSGVSWRVLGPIVYADLDGDGDEDAAAGLHAEGDQLFSSAWYLWEWVDGTARQARQPVAQATRCEGLVESVSAKPTTVVVQTLVKEDDDTCATSGSVPVTYEVGLRAGWPVRVSPQYGPVQTCNPHDQTAEVVPGGPLRLFTSPDPRAPEVDGPVRAVKVRFDRITGQGNAVRLVPGWLLATVELEPNPYPRRFCAWVQRSEVLGE